MAVTTLVLYNTNCKPAEKVMQFDGDNPTFFCRDIAADLVMQGIYIPPGLEKDYGGRQIVFLPEQKKGTAADFPLFKKAFMEVYVPQLRGYEFKAS